MSEANGESLSGQSSLAALVRTWINALPDETANVVRLGAIPQVLDVALLGVLLEDAAVGVDAFNVLRTLSHVSEDKNGRLTYTPSVREVLLLEWWATEEKVGAYRQANRRLLPALEARVQKATGTPRQLELLRWVYHTLAADNAEGLVLVDQVYTHALVFYQLALAEQLLARLEELTPVLNKNAQHWLQYFRSDLKLARRETPEACAQEFEALAEDAGNERLHNLARLKRGLALLAQQKWSAALADFKACQTYFEAQQNDPKLGEVFYAYGNAYEDLAQKLGGLHQADMGKRKHWLTRVFGAPVELFRHAVRHWSWASELYFSWGTRPGRFGAWLTALYVGTNYQDWIISRLMIEAIHGYQRAETEFQTSEQPYRIVNVQERLAVLYYQLGHQHQSQTLLDSLLESSWIQNNPYRMAQVIRSQGEIGLISGKFDRAEQALASSTRTLESLEDWESVGNMALARSRCHILSGNYQAALGQLEQTIHTLSKIEDDLGRTEAVVMLEALAEQPNLPEAIHSRVKEISGQVQNHSFIERFPGPINRRFWMPNILAGISTWIVTFIMIGLTTIIFAGFEADTRLEILGWNLSSIIAMVLTLPLIVWSYTIIYTFVGAAFSALQASLTDLENAQPGIYLCTETSLKYRQPTSDIPDTEISWGVHPHAVSRSVCYTKTHIPLLSNLTLVSGSADIVINGAANHFRSLKNIIASKVDADKWKNYDTVVFGKLWTSALLAGCVILGLIIAVFSAMDVTTGLEYGVSVFGICIEYIDKDTGEVRTFGECPNSDVPPENTKTVEVTVANVYWSISLVLWFVFPTANILRLAYRRFRAKWALRAIRRRQ